MYFKKILLAIALIGLAIIAFVSYNIYDIMFNPNTTFEDEEIINLVENQKSRTYSFI